MPQLLNKTNLPNYSSAPPSATNGDIYYNTTDHIVYARVNGAWVDLGSGGSEVYYQASAPSSPSDGDIWIDSDDEIGSAAFTITDSISTTSSTTAASATAVKKAYDLAGSLESNLMLMGG